MKISNKEKIMLSILGMLAIGVGYYNFIYTPMNLKVKEKSNQKTELETKYNTAINTINLLDSRESDLKILKSRISDRSKIFYPIISEEHIILELDKLLNDNGLEGTILFEPVVSQKVEDEKNENVDLQESSFQSIVDKYSKLNSTEDNKNNETVDKDIKNNSNDTSNSKKENSENTSSSNQSKDNTNSENKKDNTVQYLNCTINFKGSYNGVKSFLQNIRKNEKKIVVNSLNISQDTLDGVNGNVKLEIYSIPKIDNELENYLKWDYKNTYGKEIPFSVDSATGVSSMQQEASDFVIASKSINSDLPTTIIGKTSDEERVTYVYADKNGVEEAELILTQEGDNFYYKYKTSKESYPKDYNGKGVQFAPVSNGKISVDIMSESRLNSDDKSGLKLKITNNTDSLVNINVSNDDSSNPRVTIDGDSKKISVNQK